MEVNITLKKKLFKNIMTFSELCVLGVTGCSDSTQAYSSGERTTQEMSQTAPMQQSQETNEDENDTEPTASESVGILDNFMLVFAQAHSASSSVSITYPYHENRFFCQTCIFTGRKPDQGAFADLLSCVGPLPFS